MQPLTAPAAQANPGPQAARGRWIWRLSGAGTVIALCVFGAWDAAMLTKASDGQPLIALPVRTVVIAQPVTGVNVASYGAPIRVAVGPVSEVTVREKISFNGPTPPTVTSSVSHGSLTLAAPSCLERACSVSFTVTVPASVAVNASSQGGPVSVSGATTADIDSGGAPVWAEAIRGALTVTTGGGSVDVHGAGSANLDSGGGPVNADGIRGTFTATTEGGHVEVDGSGSATIDSGGGPVNATAVLGTLTVTADGGGISVAGAKGADLDSGGGPVSASGISGPLTASTDGGGLYVDGLTGPFSASTGGGPVSASGVASATSRVATDSGGAWISYSKAPRTVQVTTSGGPAHLELPAGPYAVTTESLGGPEQVSVRVSRAAASTISVSTDGGGLQITPPGAGA